MAYTLDYTGQEVDQILGRTIPTKTSDLNNDSGFVVKSVNDLVNYYLKSETYNRAEVAALIGAIQQFHYEIYAQLPETGQGNVLYLIGPTGTGSDKYDEYVYANSTWVKIGDTSIDLSGYATTEELNEALAEYTTTENLITMLERKANVDGWYSTLIAGASENLVGADVDSAFFTRRATPSGFGDGAGIIQTIKGRTLKWNQKCRGFYTTTNNGVTFTVASDGTITANGTATGGIARLNSNSPLYGNGHKFLIKGCPNGGSNSTYWFLDSNGPGTAAVTDYGSGVIYTKSGASSIIPAIRIAEGVTVTNLVFRPMFIDLTEMFGGAGYEPSTVAEFEALFPDDYYAYNPGTIINLKATGMESTGFNQWDEEWEANKSINQTTGAVENFTGNSVSKNYIPVFPSTGYYYLNGTWGNQRIAFYDTNKQFISFRSTASNGVFTTPANCSYIKFYWLGTIYNHDICINLSDPDRNGQYEPYKKTTLDLPITTKTGKLNGEGESVVPFVNGANGWGAAFDEMTREKGAKVMGAVDLGNLEWEQATGESRFYTRDIADAKVIEGDTSYVAAAICSKYSIVSRASLANNTLSIHKASGATNDLVSVIDNAYTDAASFKAAMAGVKLVYHLDTPQEYIWDEPLNLNFESHKGGTEAEIPENTETPTTAPLSADIVYPLDAVGILTARKKDMITAESMQAFLTECVSKGIFASATMTYNSTTQKYDFTITKP